MTINVVENIIKMGTYSVDFRYAIQNESHEEKGTPPSDKKVVIGGIGNNQVPIDIGMANVSININGNQRFLPGSESSLTLQNQNPTMIEQMYQTLAQLAKEDKTDCILVIEILKNIYIGPIHAILERICSGFESNMDVLVIVSNEIDDTSTTIEKISAIHESIHCLRKISDVGIFIQQKYGMWCPPPPIQDEIISTCVPDHETLKGQALIGSSTSKITVSGSKEVPTVFRMNEGDIGWIIRVNPSPSPETSLNTPQNETVVQMLTLIGEMITLAKKTESDSSKECMIDLYEKYCDVNAFYEINASQLGKYKLDKKMEILPLIVFVLNKILTQIISIVSKIVTKIHQPPQIEYLVPPKRRRHDTEMHRASTVPYTQASIPVNGLHRQSFFPGANSYY